MPGVALVVCGAPLARRAGSISAALVNDGWDVSVVGTPSSASWIDEEEVLAVIGERPRFNFRAPAQPKQSVTPDVVCVCPATFNTVNKAAAGLADNYAVSLVCEALGARIPILIAPMINQKLWGHFALASSLGALRGAGVEFYDIQTGGSEPLPVESGSGEFIVENFRPAGLAAALRLMT
jgi:phosphopantothenoylcysteine synthetase/decarboxylase